jgi:hypothetical protein
MSLTAITDTEADPLVLTTSIFPDWSQGVLASLSYASSRSASRSGLEQGHSRGKHAKKSLELTVDGMGQEAALDIFSVMENRGRGPLLIPWFSEGLRLSSSIAGAATSAQVEVAPLGDWLPGNAGQVLVGTYLRTVTGIADRVLTFAADGSAPAAAAGTWIYPMRLAAIERPDDSLAIIRHDAARQRLRFVALSK